MSCLVSQMKSIPVPKKNTDVDMDVSLDGQCRAFASHHLIISGFS